MGATAKSIRGRLLLTWGLLGCLAVVGTIGTLLALSPQVYSANAFVARYFDAVMSRNITEVLRTPGVAVGADELEARGFPASASRALLRSGTMTSGPTAFSVAGDSLAADGTHTVTVSYTLAGAQHSTTYSIASEPSLLGVIPRWRFAESPLQLLSVTVQSGTHFTIGGLTLDARAASQDSSIVDAPVGHYLAIAPANYTLGYESELAIAKPSVAPVAAGESNAVEVKILPTPLLTEQVQNKLDGFLSECVQQTVLQPAGCPFGATIDDRVLGDPEWTVVQDPVVTLESGEGGFVMPDSPGVMHLNVPIQQLFDGTKTTLDEDVTFTVGLLVRVRDDGTIAIQLR